MRFICIVPGRLSRFPIPSVCKDETKKYIRMHGAWSVGLIAGDNYVTAGSQRVAQGGIDNFDARVRLVVGGAILGWSSQ